MKNNLFLQIIIISLIAYILAYHIYNNYKTNLVINETDTVYFLQEGVYISENSINKLNCPNITVNENNKYYTYLGMTLDKEIAEHIKEIYKKENINVYIKEVGINNRTFVSEISQYDILLKTTNNLKEINNILDTVLSTYQETIQEI